MAVAPPASSAAARLIEPLWSNWLTVMIPLGAMAMATVLAVGTRSISDFFFWQQDGLVALAMTALLRLLTLTPGWKGPAAWERGRPTVFVLAIVVMIVAYAGVWIVLENYPLSMDEFMARFDARIFSSGHFAAPVPAEWRDYLPALQPTFLLHVPGDAFWVSNYLPVNAAFLALGSVLGSAQAVGPIWAGLSIVAVYGVGRELWPDRPRMALSAALLLATSSQFLITAMTPYAMSAHLALDLVWLWLVLKGGWRENGLAAVVAFLACGLHQLVFNLLFAAPFVLQMWLDRRWRPALWHTAAYAAICLFWIFYWPIMFKMLGVHGTATGSFGGPGAFVGQVLNLVRNFNPLAIPLMAENLIRFATWQSLLTLPLALFAARFAIRSPGPLRCLLVGPILMLLTAFVVLPFQGHGWGYRYLHGFLGSVCLLAAWGWDRLIQDADPAGRKAAGWVFALAAIASVLLLFPLRAWQANQFLHPYAAAERAIQSTRANLVLVDSLGVLYGTDLVRNDPLFQRRPVVVLYRGLDHEHLRRLCEIRDVALFSGPTALSYGIRPQSAFAGKGSAAADSPEAVPMSIAQACRR
jgi:hypothetical protein